MDNAHKPNRPGGEVAELSLHHTVARTISGLLEAGTIPSGVGVNETMVAQMFQVSRTTSRQALEYLAEGDWICPMPTRGYATGGVPRVFRGKLTDFDIELPALDGSAALDPKLSALWETAERQITQLSVLGTWRVSMRAAMDHFGVARGRLEDMFRDMEGWGLLARRPGGQWIIPAMNVERLEHLFDVRAWLEPQLIEQAAIHIPLSVLDEAIEAHENGLSRLPDITGPDLDALEMILHRTLLGYAGNPPGLAALRTVNAGLILSKHVLATEEIPVGPEDPFIEEHLGVLGALRRRSSEESKLRLLAHLLKSREKCTVRLERFRKAVQGKDCSYAKRISG